MARQSTIETTISTNCDEIALAFDNGQILRVYVEGLAPDIRAMALAHGLKQKLVDAAAISRNTDTGKSATTEDKYNAVREVYDRLLAGQWNKTREGGAGGASGGLLFGALCRLYAKKTPDEVRAFLETKSDEEKAQMRKLPAIAAHIEQIKSERAKPGSIDADALLAGLNDE
jgi:hypothetical protein